MRRWILALLVLGSIGQVRASCLGDPCWSHGVEAIGEFLYLRPTLCDLNWVIIDGREVGAQEGQIPTSELIELLPSGTKVGQCPGYDAAFRAGGAYVFNDGCNDLAVTYTGLWQRSKKSVELPEGSLAGLWATFGHPKYLSLRLNGRAIVPSSEANLLTKATHDLRIAYSMIDGTMAIRRMEACNLLIRRYIGLRWADLQVRRTARYLGVSTENGATFANEIHDVNQRVHLWGIGPRVGADLRWGLICGFGIGAHAGASVLVGETDLSLDQHDVIQVVNLPEPGTDQRLDIKERQRCHLVPEIDLRLGFNYLWCCGSCLSLLVEVGYQFESYINAINDLRFNDQGGTSCTVCQSFNLDGFYVHFTVAL